LDSGAVVFLGTVPVLDGHVRASARFEGELCIAGIADPLRISYQIARSQMKGE